MTPSFCPFCGNEPDNNPHQLYFTFQILWSVHCITCEYYGPPGRTPELAIAAWNERHSPYQDEIDQLIKELAALRAEKIYKERNR